MNEIKSQTQQAEFDKCKDMQRVILQWATGVGKSKGTIDLIKHICKKYRHKPEVYFIVAERAHIKNWQDEFRKWSLDTSAISLHMLCYASLHKIRDKFMDILILDEGHHAFTEKRMDVLSNVHPMYVYMLSATLSKNKISQIEDIFGKFYISKVTLKYAIDKSILPDPKLYIKTMELDNTVPNQEIVIEGPNPVTVKWEDRNRYIFKKIPCIIKCTQRQKYIYYSNLMEYWKGRYQHSHNEFHHNKWVNLGSQRKRYLGSLKSQDVRNLLNTLPKNTRYICFCASVNQAEELGSKTAISSRRKNNQEIIDAFNSKKTNTLFAVNMATEGMNLTDIQVGIIVQLDGNERQFVQKFGRSLRAEDPVTYIFYYKDTQDETYLKNALENIDEKFIKYI